MRARLATALALGAGLCGVWTADVLFSGGFHLSFFGVTVASHSVWRPIAAGLLAIAALVWIEGAPAFRRRVDRAARPLTAARLAAVLACVVFLLGIRFGTWTAGGPDPFAYVSQAALWRTGHVRVPMPLARDAPWPNALATFTPWGYAAAADGTPALVPATAAGLPLVMAAAQRAGGFAAAFAIAPFAAAALVWLSFSIARRIRSPDAGLIAACLMATSPAVLFMAMWPMTDVPAAACTAWMIWLLLGSSTRAAFVAGLAASVGLLLRPTFASLIAGAFVWLAMDLLRRARTRDARWRLASFTAGVLPGIAAAAALNLVWHGSFLASGYGSIGALLSVARVGPNLMRYAHWLAETSPLVAAGAVALIWLAVRAKGAAHRAFLLLAILAAAAWMPYLLYERFDEWWYLRFLLPAWPPMCVAAAAMLDALHTRGRVAAAAVVLIAAGAGVAGISISRARGAFDLNERRYATVARLVAAVTEPSAVILTVQHSGTVRFYGGRQAMRWDVLDPAALDRAIDWLTAHRRHAYLLIEDWEEPQFEARFASGNRNGRLSWSPVAAWQSIRADGWIFLFDPATRDAATWNPGPEFERAEAFCPRPAANPWPN